MLPVSDASREDLSWRESGGSGGAAALVRGRCYFVPSASSASGGILVHLAEMLEDCLDHVDDRARVVDERQADVDGITRVTTTRRAEAHLHGGERCDVDAQPKAAVPVVMPGTTSSDDSITGKTIW
jgi:hypothetical protein